MSGLRVLVVDDHPVVAEGLRMLLDAQPDMVVVGTAPSLDGALASPIDEPGPDVVLADLVLGPAQGAELVAALRSRFPDAGVLVLTMADDWAVVKSVLTAGAQGYLPKAAAGTDLVDAVRRVGRGEHYLHHSVGVAMARGDAHAGRPPAARLSEREAAVGRLLALGHTNAEVAGLLFVSVRTVETYRAQVFRKLGVHTRAELVRAAALAGLVDLAPPA